MGFLDIEQGDIFKLENYCTKWGIKQNKFKKDFVYELEDNKQEVEYYNELRKRIIEPIEKLRQKIRKEKTAKAVTLAIYEFLEEQKI